MMFNNVLSRRGSVPLYVAWRGISALIARRGAADTTANHLSKIASTEKPSSTATQANPTNETLSTSSRAVAVTPPSSRPAFPSELAALDKCIRSHKAAARQHHALLNAVAAGNAARAAAHAAKLAEMVAAYTAVELGGRPSPETTPATGAAATARELAHGLTDGAAARPTESNLAAAEAALIAGPPGQEPRRDQNGADGRVSPNRTTATPAARTADPVTPSLAASVTARREATVASATSGSDLPFKACRVVIRDTMFMTEFDDYDGSRSSRHHQGSDDAKEVESKNDGPNHDDTTTDDSHVATNVLDVMLRDADVEAAWAAAKRTLAEAVEDAINSLIFEAVERHASLSDHSPLDATVDLAGELRRSATSTTRLPTATAVHVALQISPTAANGVLTSEVQLRQRVSLFLSLAEQPPRRGGEMEAVAAMPMPVSPASRIHASLFDALDDSERQRLDRDVSLVVRRLSSSGAAAGALTSHGSTSGARHDGSALAPEHNSTAPTSTFEQRVRREVTRDHLLRHRRTTVAVGLHDDAIALLSELVHVLRNVRHAQNNSDGGDDAIRRRVGESTQRSDDGCGAMEEGDAGGGAAVASSHGNPQGGPAAIFTPEEVSGCILRKIRAVQAQREVALLQEGHQEDADARQEPLQRQATARRGAQSMAAGANVSDRVGDAATLRRVDDGGRGGVSFVAALREPLVVPLLPFPAVVRFSIMAGL